MCVYVSIPKSNVNVVAGRPDIIPVFPSSVNFRFNDASGGSFLVKCVQVPLVPAFAFTDYKSQGRTLDWVVVNLAKGNSLQSIYVMLSRATGLQRILVLRWFPPNKVYQCPAQDLRDEFKHLEVIAEQTEC